MRYRYSIVLKRENDDGTEIVVGCNREAEEQEEVTLAVIKTLNAFDKRCQEEEESCRLNSRSS